jgi:hypothetical protein
MTSSIFGQFGRPAARGGRSRREGALTGDGDQLIDRFDEAVPLAGRDLPALSPAKAGSQLGADL